MDTPGFMVGPESERQAAVRKTSRLFIHGANLSTPIFAVVLRKAYGLGAMAMTGGGLADPMFTVSWPTGEFGGMGLEGAVRLAYRRELEAAPRPGGEAGPSTTSGSPNSMPKARRWSRRPPSRSTR